VARDIGGVTGCGLDPAFPGRNPGTPTEMGRGRGGAEGRGKSQVSFGIKRTAFKTKKLLL